MKIIKKIFRNRKDERFENAYDELKKLNIKISFSEFKQIRECLKIASGLKSKKK